MTVAQMLYAIVFLVWNASSLFVQHPQILGDGAAEALRVLEAFLPVMMWAHHGLFAYCVIEFIIKHKDDYM